MARKNPLLGVLLIIGIIALTYLLFFSPLPQKQPSGSNDSQKETLVAMPESPPDSSPTLNGEQVSEKQLSGEVYFQFIGVNATRKYEDFARIDAISFYIRNEKISQFAPELLLFIYDENDVVQMRSIEQGSYMIEPLESGEARSYTIFPNHGINDFNSTKVLKFRFKTGNIVKDYEEFVNFSEYFGPLPEEKDPITIAEETVSSEATTYNVSLVDFKIEKRGDDYIIVKSVRLGLNNTWNKVRSLSVQLYIFDENDDPYFWRIPRETFDFNKLDALEYNEYVFPTSIGFNEIHRAKTVRMRLLDDNKRILEENNIEVNFGESK